MKSFLTGSFFFLSYFFSFGQEGSIQAIYRRKQVSFTITCFKDSMIIYTGKFKTYDFISDGNAVKITKGDNYIKSDSCNVLNFYNNSLSTNKEDFIVLSANQRLKIRILPKEHVRISKRKKLLIYITINGELYQVYAKHYGKRIRLIEKQHSPEYVKL